MSETRLPAHLEVSGLIRQVNAAGGFAAVIAKGEPDAGTIMVLTSCNGTNIRLYERMPQAGGHRAWECVRSAETSEDDALKDYVERRQRQDSDLWIVELDIAQAERFIGLDPSAG